MKMLIAREKRGSLSRRHPIRVDGARVRLWLAVLLLALLPATSSVLLTFALASARPGQGSEAERARATATAAADLLMRAQAIESRLANVAADGQLLRLANDSVGGGLLAGRLMQRLRGNEGASIISACITRLDDGRMTLLVDEGSAAVTDRPCASGPQLTTASRVGPGGIVRWQSSVGQPLLLATPLLDGTRPVAVLTAGIDLQAFLETWRGMPAAAPAALVVDSDSGRFVAGTSRASVTEAMDEPPPTPRELSAYARGVVADLPETTEQLARIGLSATLAELWPTVGGSRLGLILVWPTVVPAIQTGLLFALVTAIAAGLVAAFVFMRHLLRPFRELESSRAELQTLYREAREDSLHDGLTGMGNHRAFQEELARQVAIAERDAVPVSLLLLDLDNLKVVNDRDGHAEGDQLLLSLAAAMRQALRVTDRLFRIGGDEFAVLMPDTEPEQAVEAAGRLRHYCLRPPAGERATPFSGGISAVPRFATQASTVQRQADAALYWAKRHGRGFVEVFDPERDKLANEPGPEGISNAVYEMARGRAFRPVYQPIVDLRTGAVLGFEGLVRPEPGGSFASTEALFAAAAATGRSVELDLACLETVAEGATDIGTDHILSINLSAKTLEVKDFDSGWLLNTLVRHGISPSRVIVELTERDPITDLKRLQNNVGHLSAYGLRLAADDVGAGSAGLRMLAEVPFDVVKIDLSLVQDGAQQAASWAVLRSLRDFAWRQDTVVIGEGVETPQQLRALRALDIAIGQGYHLGRPEPRPDARPRDIVRLTAAATTDDPAFAPPADHPGVAPAPRLRGLYIQPPPAVAVPPGVIPAGATVGPAAPARAAAHGAVSRAVPPAAVPQMPRAVPPATVPVVPATVP